MHFRRAFKSYRYKKTQEKGFIKGGFRWDALNYQTASKLSAKA